MHSQFERSQSRAAGTPTSDTSRFMPSQSKLPVTESVMTFLSNCSSV